MKSINYIGYGFSAAALAMFAYSFFFSGDPALREQGLYWFYTAIISALLPYIKQFKLKDVEVTFNEELKKIEKKVDDLNQNFFLAVDEIRTAEQQMSPEFKAKRDQVYRGFQEELQALPQEERLKRQEFFTRRHLTRLKVSLPEVKQKLKEGGFYKGEVDDNFDLATAAAIAAFQESAGLSPADGIFGTITYQKLAERQGTK